MKCLPSPHHDQPRRVEASTGMSLGPLSPRRRSAMSWAAWQRVSLDGGEAKRTFLRFQSVSLNKLYRSESNFHYHLHDNVRAKIF